MNLPENLIKGVISDIYKDVIMDVKLPDDTVVPAFCPEIDYIKNLYAKGVEVWMSSVSHPQRHLKYEIQLINKGDGLILVNPCYIEDLFVEAFHAGILSDFSEYTDLRKIEYGESVVRANFEFSKGRNKKCYVYLVGINNKIGPNVVFPSYISFYEMEMFEELRQLRKKGHETAVVLIVPRMDCSGVKFVWSLDQIAAAKIFDEAKNGLNFFCYGCNINQRSVTISKKIKILY